MAQPTGRMARRVLVSTLSLLFGTAANAGYYPGHIDPGGNGVDIPGFTADVVFNIPDNCFTDGTGWKPTTQNVGPSGGCGNATLVSGAVYLYSTSPSDPPSGPILDQFTLSNFDLLGIYSSNNVLLGVDSDPMGPEFGSSTYSGDTFWLQFVSGFCTTGCTAPGFDPGYLSVNDIDNVGPPGTVIFGPACRTDPNGAPIDCVITATVPEPGTLALLFGALGGGWLTRRRKRNVST